MRGCSTRAAEELRFLPSNPKRCENTEAGEPLRSSPVSYARAWVAGPWTKCAMPLRSGCEPPGPRAINRPPAPAPFAGAYAASADASALHTISGVAGMSRWVTPRSAISLNPEDASGGAGFGCPIKGHDDRPEAPGGASGNTAPPQDLRADSRARNGVHRAGYVATFSSGRDRTPLWKAAANTRR